MRDPQSPALQHQPVPPARERLIVALDYPSLREATHCLDRLEGSCQWFKVGLELYLAAGAAIVDHLHQRGFSVFLDLKFHDIPNTVAGAVASAGRLGVQLLTVHAAGGPAMLSAAAGSAARLSNPPRLLAVTVLTSMDQEQLEAIGVERTPAEQVLRLARLASASRITGLVCSPEETATIRRELPGAFLVTPGIRPAGSTAGDQKRIATPGAALHAGSDFLVVGRPITQAASPLAAAQGILEEIDKALRQIS